MSGNAIAAVGKYLFDIIGGLVKGTLFPKMAFPDLYGKLLDMPIKVIFHEAFVSHDNKNNILK